PQKGNRRPAGRRFRGWSGCAALSAGSELDLLEDGSVLTKVDVRLLHDRAGLERVDGAGLVVPLVVVPLVVVVVALVVAALVVGAVALVAAAFVVPQAAGVDVAGAIAVVIARRVAFDLGGGSDLAGDRAAGEQVDGQGRAVERGDLAGLLISVLDAVVVAVG